MKSKSDIRVRKTPNALHPYTATMRGKGTYGWGNSPAEARARLAKNLAAERREARRSERDFYERAFR